MNSIEVESDVLEMDINERSGDDVFAIRACPDCGMPGEGAFCSQCGEGMEPSMPEVRHYVRELINEFLAFDSRLARTFPALLLRPGFLTLEYIKGRRKRYLMPTRLFMMVAVLAFVLLGNFIHTHLTHYFAQQRTTTLNMFTLKGKDAENYLDLLLRLYSESLPYGLLVLCTPAFAAFLKILYRKKGFLFSEHLVFTFHVFAFLLLVMIPLTIFSPTYGATIGALSFFCYLFLAIKRVHNDRGWRLTARFTLTSFAFVSIVSVIAFTTLILTLGLGTYFGQLPKALP